MTKIYHCGSTRGDNIEVPLSYFTVTGGFYFSDHYYPERQWWTVGQPQGPALRGDGLLTGLGVNDGDTLFFKDLGRHLSIVIC